MARNLPPLNSLHAFEAAARLKSFAQAAEELHVTPGAISRHVKILEEWLGRSLFERLNRHVELTGAGEEYLAEAALALDRIELATSRQLEKSRQSLLRVNALATFTMRWLIPRLSSFQVENPGIEVRITTSHEPLALVRGAFDITIRGGPEDAPGYVAREFLREHRGPVCSPDLIRRQPLRKPGDLRRHTLLHTATLPGVWPEWLRLAGVPDLAPKASLTLEHFYLTLQAAVDGLGIAIGPEALVADDVAEGRLVKPFAEPMLPEWRYFAYVRRNRAEDAAIAKFCEWLEVAGKRRRRKSDR
jgi:LysR family transcriptional regulator, glycine cleavage system transcriptional activator